MNLPQMDSTLLIWIMAVIVGIVTPLLGYLSPFGRVRRAMVSDLQTEIDALTQKIEVLKIEVTALTEKIGESERARGRLERENYRLYRLLDEKSLGKNEGV